MSSFATPAPGIRPHPHAQVWRKPPATRCPRGAVAGATAQAPAILRALRYSLFASIALACSWSLASDLGAIGPTYSIAEPHLLRDIEQRLRAKERSGELQRLIDEARDRGIRSVRDPAPVPGLSSGDSARSHFVDPSIVLDRAVGDGRGGILYPAGFRANPLDVVSMSRQLLFFDARDPRQRRQARQLLDAQPGQLTLILTGGSPLDLMRAWRVPAYYDQQGVLVRRLGIRQVPAVVSQDGRRLRIDELALR